MSGVRIEFVASFAFRVVFVFAFWAFLVGTFSNFFPSCMSFTFFFRICHGVTVSQDPLALGALQHLCLVRMCFLGCGGYRASPSHSCMRRKALLLSRATHPIQSSGTRHKIAEVHGRKSAFVHLACPRVHVSSAQSSILQQSPASKSRQDIVSVQETCQDDLPNCCACPGGK